MEFWNRDSFSSVTTQTQSSKPQQHDNMSRRFITLFLRSLYFIHSQGEVRNWQKRRTSVGRRRDFLFFISTMNWWWDQSVSSLDDIWGSQNITSLGRNSFLSNQEVDSRLRIDITWMWRKDLMSELLSLVVMSYSPSIPCYLTSWNWEAKVEELREIDISIAVPLIFQGEFPLYVSSSVK